MKRRGWAQFRLVDQLHAVVWTCRRCNGVVPIIVGLEPLAALRARGAAAATRGRPPNIRPTSTSASSSHRPDRLAAALKVAQDLAFPPTFQYAPLPDACPHCGQRPDAQERWRLETFRAALEALLQSRAPTTGVLSLEFPAPSPAKLATTRRGRKQLRDVVPSDPPKPKPPGKPLANDPKRQWQIRREFTDAARVKKKKKKRAPGGTDPKGGV